jgi:hypothetical protein
MVQLIMLAPDVDVDKQYISTSALWTLTTPVPWDGMQNTQHTMYSSARMTGYHQVIWELLKFCAQLHEAVPASA